MKCIEIAPSADDDIPGLGEKAAYGLGDFASSLVLMLVSSFMLLFYTTAGGLGMGAASLILLIARVANVLVDPLIGSAIDATKSRYAVPAFLKWGAIPLGILTMLAFCQPFADPGYRFVWSLSTFTLLNIVYSLVNTPYGAMTLLIAKDERSRFDLNRYRFVGSNLGVIAVGALVSPALGVLGGGGRSFAIVGAIVGGVAAALVLAAYAGCTIRVDPSPQHIGVMPATIRLVSKPRWLVVTTAMACSNVVIGSIFGLIPFVGPSVYHLSNIRVAMVFTILNAAAIVGTAIAGWFSQSRGSEFGFAIGFFGQTMSLGALWFHPVLDSFSILIFAVLGVFLGVCYPTSYTALATAIDAAERGGGHSLTGLGYALSNAITKLASGFGGVIAATALSVSRAQHGTASAELTMLAGMTLAPALFCLFAIGLLIAARKLFS